MKQRVFFCFSVGAFLLLSGCSLSSSHSKTSIDLFDLYGQHITYKVSSNIFPGSFTGRKEKKELFFSYSNDYDLNNVLLGYNNITGNMYIYYFDDLGIKVTFDDPAATYFNPKNPEYFEPYMYYSGNTLFYGKPRDKYHQFIAIFPKNPTISLSEAIYHDHKPLLKNNCTPKYRSGLITVLTGSEDQYDIYYIVNNTGDMCFLGLFFVMYKPNPDRYYLLSYPDGCAPSCNTFTRIEFSSTNKK